MTPSQTAQNPDDAHTSAPEHPDQPDSPTQIDKRSWAFVARKSFREFLADQCQDIAASLTYYGVLALFPGLLAVFSLLGVVGQGQQAADAVLGIIGSIAPGDTVDMLEGPVTDIANSPAAGFALISGLVLAIWSASGYVGAFTRGMNRIYGVDEGRPFLKLKPLQLLVTLITVVMIALAAVLLVISGPIAQAIGDAIGLGDVAVTVWNIARWPVLAAIVVLLIAMLYYATPNVKQPKFRWISMGAILAIVILLIASIGFAFYVANFSNYNRTYGSFAGVIVFLLWLWIANIALLIGAEFDAEMERGRELEAGLPAEERIQLPLRDDKRIEKAAEAHRKDVAKAREIRRDND
ncbi:YihY/virulence factor BrkB family protein [Microbacterium oryzae]|uniref:YihY/virulence factor BrkB family protein n=1 Tax=Microbacterium oryzae TaxID=743009 RepID=A0A6I6DZA3_9MICO|nr:YihY/virulence factor BrkB family protein [Microbacterium oryzae]QGU28103.1 YihY/virulence factor BrkB family protein [Microbacterium oryzae]